MIDKNKIVEDLSINSEEIKPQEQIETENHNITIEIEQQKISHRSDIHTLDVAKYELAKKVYIALMYAVVVYIAVVLFISIFSEIDKHIIITMLSTTTANVIGVFMIASKWLFYNKSK